MVCTTAVPATGRGDGTGIRAGAAGATGVVGGRFVAACPVGLDRFGGAGAGSDAAAVEVVAGSVAVAVGADTAPACTGVATELLDRAAAPRSEVLAGPGDVGIGTDSDGTDAGAGLAGCRRMPGAPAHAASTQTKTKER
ncbi:MAG: hypothetical protein IT479_09020 [Xanthomonadales bacterium]|nr:hypothetical protein [Xanthomonadales bacterium]MCE7930586.1 hypothetical protein [Xanthomonadales bacterium PRO6]